MFFMCFYILQPIVAKFVARSSHFQICHGNVRIRRLLKQGEILVLTAVPPSVAMCTGDGDAAMCGQIPFQSKRKIEE